MGLEACPRPESHNKPYLDSQHRWRVDSAGSSYPPGALGINYALSAMFICLLVFQLRGRLYVIVSIIAGILAVILSLLLPGNSYIVVASVIAATLGVFLKRSKSFAGTERKS